MPKDILVVFDYSGTLSLEAPLFASTENLLRQLKQSGLMALGIKTEIIFWDNIVNPTWQEGSTTSIGYKQLLRRRIKQWTDENYLNVDEKEIAEAASLFVDNYMNQSRIDSRWQPFLLQLQNIPHVRTIIATDHYAEATNIIITYLNQCQIEAIPLRDAPPIAPGQRFFIVANSADLGYHKSEYAFWVSIRDTLAADRIQYLILIDDFGFNEQPGDVYSHRDKVHERRRSTIHLIQDVFPTKVIVIPFFSEAPPNGIFAKSTGDKKSYFDHLIKKTSSIIESYLIDFDQDL